MRLIIAGSRDIKDKEQVFTYLNDKIDANQVTEVISGKAEGVDTIGEMWAEENNIDVNEFPYSEYESDKNRKPAPLIRNDKMAQRGDVLVAIWDGESNGTEYMIEKAKEENLEVYIDRIDNKNLSDFGF